VLLGNNVDNAGIVDNESFDDKRIRKTCRSFRHEFKELVTVELIRNTSMEQLLQYTPVRTDIVIGGALLCDHLIRQVGE
jgi:hypothetical protein